jgi:GNAT superfamily N-acetyltransferase
LTLRIDWLPVRRLSELQTFIDRRWRRGHVLAHDAELLRWQHRRPGDEGRLSVVTAEQAGELVGMLGIVAFEACVHGERGRGGWMTNWLVVPELRGQGIGRRLLERALEELELVGALAGNATTERVLGRLGFAEMLMRRWVRVFSVAALERLLDSAPALYPDAAWRAWRAQETSGDRSCGDAVHSWSEDGWDAAWAHLAPEFVGASRDAGHLRRRFLEHPRFRYELLAARDTAGFAAYRLERPPDAEVTIMRIVDLLAADFDGAAALLGALSAVARLEKVAFADFACTSTRFEGVLAAAGFADDAMLPASLPGRFQPLDFADRPLVCSFWIDPRHASDSGSFFTAADPYVTRSDSDLDRPN